MASKILILAYDFPPQWGGVATYGWELARAFEEAGNQVEVISKKPNDDRKKKFKVTRFKLPNIGILAIPVLTAQLVKHLRTHSYDHIYCCLWLPEGVALWAAKKILKLKTPYSVAAHGMEILDSNESLKKRFRGKLEPLKRRVFQEAENVFCVSQFTKNLLTSTISIEDKKLHVVHNGANAESFDLLAKKDQKGPLLFTACRLMPHKGIDQVIKTLPTLVKTFPEIQYRIAGEGPDLSRLQQLTKMMGMEKHIQFLGKISHKELNRQYTDADLFVMISRREKHHVEGFGLVFLEAAICQTPSLGGDSGGIPDAIVADDTGWLVDPYDENKVEDKLLQLLSEPEKLKSTGKRARELTVNERTWKHQALKILETLNGN